MELLLVLILIAVGGLPLLGYAIAGLLAVAIVPTAFVLLLMAMGGLWCGLTSMTYSDLHVFAGLIFLAIVCSGLFWLDRERVKRITETDSAPRQIAHQRSQPTA